MSDLHDLVRPQLDALVLVPGRPLVVTDADEVLFFFLEGFEAYLEDHGHYLDLTSFALIGNVKVAGSGAMATAEAAAVLLDGFFRERTAIMKAVPGAAAALAALSLRAQIVVLSNLPDWAREAREQALELNGMAFPVVVNTGLKGAAVRHMAERVAAPVFFLDDIPRNHMSVAMAAPQVMRLHFVADGRLQKLIGPAEHCTHRVDDWIEARRLIEAELDRLGY